jgi:hypothetical protein
MKNSIKTLTILLVTFLFSNVAFGQNTYTRTNSTWTPSTPNLGNLTSQDIIIITNTGTTNAVWTPGQSVTVKEVRLIGVSTGSARLDQASNSLNGNIIASGTNTQIIGSGQINGIVTLSSGTLTVATTKTASSWTLNAGTLSNASALTGAPLRLYGFAIRATRRSSGRASR